MEEKIGTEEAVFKRKFKENNLHINHHNNNSYIAISMEDWKNRNR